MRKRQGRPGAGPIQRGSREPLLSGWYFCNIRKHLNDQRITSSEAQRQRLCEKGTEGTGQGPTQEATESASSAGRLLLSRSIPCDSNGCCQPVQKIFAKYFPLSIPFVLALPELLPWLGFLHPGASCFSFCATYLMFSPQLFSHLFHFGSLSLLAAGI